MLPVQKTDVYSTTMIAGEDLSAMSFSVVFYDSIELIPDTNSISVYKMPDKIVYEIGEVLDITGLSLKFSYANGSFEIIESGIEFKKVILKVKTNISLQLAMQDIRQLLK